MIPFWAETTKQVQIRAKSGHLIWVHPIHGLPKSILVHPKSRAFYESYWQEGDNPGERKTREWRCYHNVWSLHRGLELARIRAIKQRLPLLQELYDQCAVSVAHLLGPDHRRPETLGEVAGFAAYFLECVASPQTHALRAARAQVEHAAVSTDSLGRHNPRARAARLVQVSGRHLPQRVSDIIGWLGHYAHWADDVGRLQQLAGGFLERLYHTVVGWYIGRDLPGWRSETRTNLPQVQRTLTRLAAFGGWKTWACQCLQDLKIIREDETYGPHAYDACPRLAQAVRCKRHQAAISQLMLDIEVDRISGSPNPTSYRDRLKTLREDISSADDSLLRTPVLPTIRKQLAAARAALDGNEPERTRLRATRNHLRAACNAL